LKGKVKRKDERIAGHLDAVLGLVGETDAEDDDGGGGGTAIDELPALALALLFRLETEGFRIGGNGGGGGE
jgi:hypothetical protein